MILATPIVHHPLAYNVGPLQFTGFGLAVLLAFVIAQIVAMRELRRRGHDNAYMPDLLFAAIIGGLLGAKIYYAILMGSASELLSRAGFVFWGGLIGGILAVVLVILKRKLPLQRIADPAGMGIAAAYAVGRTGCWAVGDDYGRPWNGPLATAFPEGAPPSTAGVMQQLFGIPIPTGMPPETVLAVHPTQLYETTMGLLMFAVLWRMRDHKHAEGWLFGVYCVLAGVERFIVEFFRAKDDRFFGPFTTAQLISLAFIVVGVIWMMARNTPGNGKAGIYGVSRIAPAA